MLLVYATAVGCTAVCFGAEEKIHINSFILVLFYLLKLFLAMESHCIFSMVFYYNIALESCMAF